MGHFDRITKRLAKEEIEREALYLKGKPEREKRYVELEALIAKYDAICRAEPYTIPEEARFLWRHIMEEHSHDLVFFFSRVRAGKEP